YLRKLMPRLQITLVNRDMEKLKAAASMFNTQGISLENLHAALKDTDALVVATNANKPLIRREHLIGSRIRYIFDLSVPQNVSDDIYAMDQISCYKDRKSTRLNSSYV